MCMCVAAESWGQVDSNEIVVGYMRSDESTDLCNDSYREFARGALWFDLSGIRDKITSAQLEMDWSKGYYDPNGEGQLHGPMSCAGSLALATANWKDSGTNTLSIPIKDYRPLQITYLHKNLLTIDVTDTAEFFRKNPTQNFGYVLLGTDETNPTNNVNCFTIYKGMRLKLQTITE